MTDDKWQMKNDKLHGGTNLQVTSFICHLSFVIGHSLPEDLIFQAILFVDGVMMIGRNISELLRDAAGPTHLDQIDLVETAKPEMRPRVTGRVDAHRSLDLPDLFQLFSDHGDAGADAVAIALSSRHLEHDPMTRLLLIIAHKLGRAIHVGDNKIH